MWIVTQRGFVSVVEYDPKQDKHKGSPFAGLTTRRGSHVLVRSRVRNDLEDIRRVVKNMRIYDDPSADYKFRAVIKRKDFNKWLLLSADEIDYDSHFKEAAQKNSTGATGRYSAYMAVWSALMRLQTAPQYSPVRNPKPLIGPGAQYDDVNDYLTRSGFKAKQKPKQAVGTGPSAKPITRSPVWDDDWDPYFSAATKANAAEHKDEIPLVGGDLTCDDLEEVLAQTPLTAISDAVVNELDDDAFEMWCWLDAKALQNHFDPEALTPSDMVARAKEVAQEAAENEFRSGVDTKNDSE